jgi:ribonuclease HII
VTAVGTTEAVAPDESGDEGATRSHVVVSCRPTLDVERRLWRAGHRWVAGMDEVGRGAWAGPLSVGVAVVHPRARSSSMPFWLRDSKALAEERREEVFPEVARWCADGAVGHASAEECDRWGMTLAWRFAACRALSCLEVVPDALVIDGPFDLLRGTRARSAVSSDVEPEAAGRDGLGSDGDGLGYAAALALPAVPMPEVVLPVVRADATCGVVAAASILAKVVRDRLMRAESEHYPAYGFERNKGYPSTRHQIALRGYGLSAIHRRTWAFTAGLPWS